MKKIILFVSVVLWATVAAYPQNDSLNLSGDSLSVGHHTEFANRSDSVVTKAEADSAYTKGDYASAISLYETLLQEGEAAELYYNLGNSYYKSDNIGRAILNYERALLLAPGNADIRANLEIARARTVDKVIPVPEIFFVAWTKSLINLLSADHWSKIGIVAFLLLLGSLSLYFFTKQTALRKAGFIGGILFFCLVVAANIFAYRQKSVLTHRTHAIVLTPSVTVTSTPSESGTSLFILHEGRKITVKDNTMREWVEISLEDGKVGWVPAASIEII
ncbi:MAG: tetratricopeptide repeat protein [Mediterranea sp.]|jgi:tetratricopeptide (TPR) repeat protein|nr:tetratricopeptide repeat protein [Mediterranea sp.]